jgi:hypothetical protein
MSPEYSHLELVVARQIFHDMRGRHADPEREPEAWAASLAYAREEVAEYDLDQTERTGAPYPRGELTS